ncbi:hypothetical protein PybrP1_005666 [[Pythium] brassicae (nom. inval.)]|nr:hypothetical protein PybrP1_005666 [[Pythium] brassicae (nom. inval.)]
MQKEGAVGGNGFVLYNLNMDDGNSSQSSAPNAPSPYSLGPGSRLPPRTNFRAAPPPHTAVLRTNFTTNGGGGGSHAAGRGSIGALNDPSASPDASFQDIHTPHLVGHVPTPFAQPDGVSGGVGAAPLEVQLPRTSTSSMVAILAALVVGLVAGWVLNHYEVSESVTHWVRTPGDLYVRAIQCLVMPLVFVNLAVAIADLTYMGKGQAVGLRVALVFAGTTLLGVAEGIGVGLLARASVSMHLADEATSRPALFGIQCNNGQYLEMVSASGLVTCSATSLNATSTFLVEDVNKAFVTTTAGAQSDDSLSLNLIAIIELVVPANIIAAFVNNTLLSIVAFAVPAGVTLANSFHGPIQLNPLLEFLREINDSLLVMAHWVTRFTPFAVLSLLAGSFGPDLANVMNASPVLMTLSSSGILLGAVLVHALVVLPVLFALYTRSNPYTYTRQLLPALVYAFGCSSSVATLPVALHCADPEAAAAVGGTTSCSSAALSFALSAGAALNKNGTAIYLPLMVLFLVDTTGLDLEFDAVRICVLALASFLGALAAAPVPGGSLVLLTTVWKITFPTLDVPKLYALLAAADVVADRIVTLANVHGGAMAARIISAQLAPSCAAEAVRHHDQPMLAVM